MYYLPRLNDPTLGVPLTIPSVPSFLTSITGRFRSSLSSSLTVPHYHIFPFINLLGLSKDFHSPILAVTIVTQQINS